MTKESLLQSIELDLGANFKSEDRILLGQLLDECIEDALVTSNRKCLVSVTSDGSYEPNSLSNQLAILSSEIRRAVKSIYLQRGSEDVNSQSLSGISSSYDDVRKRMRDDIVCNGKRLFR